MAVDPRTRGLVKRLADRLTDLDGRLRDQARASQASRRSVEVGAQGVYDDDDELRAIVGLQDDGTYGVTTFGGTPMPAPSVPLAAQIPGGATITWDGFDELDEQGWPGDFARVQVHQSTVPGDVPDAGNQIGSFESAQGGALTIAHPDDLATYVFFVAVSTAGVESARSVETEVTGGPVAGIPTSAPRFAPRVTIDYPLQQFADDDMWPDRYGWVTDGTNWYTTRRVFLLSGVTDYVIEEWSAAGALLRTSAQLHGDGNATDTFASGIVIGPGGDLYVLVQDEWFDPDAGDNLTYDWRIIRHPKATLAQTGFAKWTGWGTHHKKGAALGYDAAAAQFIIAQPRTSDTKVEFKRYPWPAAGDLVQAGATVVGPVYNFDLAGVAYGDFDLGAPRYVFTARSGENLFRVQDAAGANMGGEYWEAPVRRAGFTWDGAAFVTVDYTGDRRTFTGLNKGTLIGDPTLTDWWSSTLANDTLGLETDQSPRRMVVTPKRSRVTVTADPIPSTGGSNVPERVRFYRGTGAADPGRAGMSQQVDPAVGELSAVYTDLTTWGASPPATNRFASSGGAGGPFLTVKEFGAVGDGVADDTAAIQDAVDAAVSAGGGIVFLPAGTYRITDTIYVNSTGDAAGIQVNGITVQGHRTSSRIDATDVAVALSFGKRTVDSNSQASGISNGIICADLEMAGAGVEFWGCQRDSSIRNVRVDLTGATTATRGIYCLFSSTLQLLQTRVDNGGANVDGIILDTCSNTVILGGGANYCRSGLTVQALLANSQRSTSLYEAGFHTEGNRRRFYDLQAVGNAIITPHIVTDDQWDVAYPLIHLGSDAATSALNVRILGGYINGSGPGGLTGNAIQSDHASNCVVDGTRIANVEHGVKQTASSVGLELRRVTFESSVINTVTNIAGSGETILPGTQLIPTCSQGGATLTATQTVSLTLGGVNSASATRIPVMRAGSVVGIGLRINATLTSGTLTIRVQKNGVDIAGCELVKGTGGSGTATVRFPPGKFPVAGTDDIRVQAVAVGIAPLTIVPLVNVEYLPG